ncbi:MAG: DUF2232 domain-containing protein [Aeromicrobium sp.]|nr:DUF2232 domain-containing protein [Aeromicrobium sp.]
MARAAGSDVTLRERRQPARDLFAVLGGAVLMVVMHPVLGLPVAAAGLASLVFARRSAMAAAACVFAGALAALIAHPTLYVVVVPIIGLDVGPHAPYVFAALTGLSLWLVGPGAVALMRTSGPYRTVAALVAGLSLLQAATLSAFAAASGMSLSAFITSAVSEMAAMAARTGALEGMEEAIVSSMPGLLVAMNGFAAVLVVATVGTIGVRRGADLRPLPPLGQVDLDPRMTILPIVAIALLAAGRMGVPMADTLVGAGANLLVVARWVFFLQGVAAFAGLYDRAGFSRGTRAIGYTLLGVTEALVPLVSLTGLVDVWLNIRRLPRDGAETDAGPSSGTEGEER